MTGLARMQIDDDLVIIVRPSVLLGVLGAVALLTSITKGPASKTSPHPTRSIST